MNDSEFSQLINHYFQNDYRERGKMKWNGFFLSDHTATLKKDDQIRHTNTEKLPAISLDVAQNKLRQAFVNYDSVTVQQNIINTKRQFVPNVTGLVNGFSDLGVYINQELIPFETIRTVIVNDHS
ncbi:hypothetical protein [Leuconostoc carnosum]|uniref:hypothetical protein n=1 Tax=Leuconostoc carnosum TaxID=1252 RepID=UPI00123C76AE|nr:hypothetical protein [Leuconostoc carnosum]KAA8372617.1 hypothetical protein FE415_04505 [Leuconostoc carnosum]KAA8374102.1 hypothetical protein FE412_04090 [Leuconostoc carnosum]KAA8376091.1 hypothetical protein FE408_04250 [Leuconostoc carnosum]KAA8377853.1 hypothetical protein FE405_04025 [Leuconostoc carnosum]MBB6432160.1 hypothetical protein [Leuconostoc carnosum]